MGGFQVNGQIVVKRDETQLSTLPYCDVNLECL